MKKLLMLLSGALVTSAAYASPVLNPAAPALNTDGLFYCCPDSCWSLRAGFRGDYVFDRKMENGSGIAVNDYELFSNEGALTLNLWERVDIYGFVGATSQNYNTDARDSNNALFHEVAELSTETIWGAGLKAVLWEWDWSCHCGRSFLAADVNYESVNSANYTNFTDAGSTSNIAALPNVSYRETQVSLAWGHRVKNLVPYIAVKWSNARANMSRTTITGNNGPRSTNNITVEGLRSRRHWGWAVGTSLVDVGRMTVSAEARFIDETAATVTGSFRF